MCSADVQPLSMIVQMVVVMGHRLLAAHLPYFSRLMAFLLNSINVFGVTVARQVLLWTDMAGPSC